MRLTLEKDALKKPRLGNESARYVTKGAAAAPTLVKYSRQVFVSTPEVALFG